MNPKYEDGTEAHLKDIVVVHRVDQREYGDQYGGTYPVDKGDVLATVVDLHPDNKKCFELKYLKDNGGKTFRIASCKLADFRDLSKLK